MADIKRSATEAAVTPQEIYELPNLSAREWYEGHNAMVETALQFEGWGHGESYILNSDTDRLAVFEKIRIGPEGRPELNVFALSIDHNAYGHPPFAVVIVRNGDIKNQETVVTHALLWQMAREHVMVMVNKNIRPRTGIAKSDIEISIPEFDTLPSISSEVKVPQYRT
ncbi:hypothetical protein HFN89_05715 [Rhizobium laguerreae]|nr:hypothetical protein [Rhizobium laguerreae]